MAVDRLAHAVREQVAFGRLLPLGTAGDGIWITERAATDVLRTAARAVEEARLGSLRVDLAGRAAQTDADAAGSGRPAGVMTPSNAVPHGPLRLQGGFEAAMEQPLPPLADRLRRCLWDAADERLGLTVVTIDLTVTGLVDEAPDNTADDTADTAVPAPPRAPDMPSAPAPQGEQTADDAARAAAAAVPGVAGLTSRLGGLTSGLRTVDLEDPSGGRHVHVQIAVTEGHRALDVARAVREAVTKAAERDAPGPVTATVVVTDVAGASQAALG